jgi:mevalonate kinase
MTERSEASASAFGKVILFGEHAVVFGTPAIAAGIPRGAHATATRLSEGAPSVLSLGDRRVTASTTSPSAPLKGNDDALGQAWSALLAVAPCPSVDVVATAELPPGGGLGCSAALGVAIARALAALAALDSTRGALAEAEAAQLIAERATAWERVHHGNPSGIDVAAALSGGCFAYSRADGVRPLRLGAPLRLAIGWTGVASSTRAMVESVARLGERRPAVLARSVEAIAALVRGAEHALQAGDVDAVGKLLDMNQLLLAGLMVSSEEIETMCSIARQNGALGAKLTGAGGGGSVIALLGAAGDASADRDEREARLLDAWRGAGFSGFVVTVEAAGS